MPAGAYRCRTLSLLSVRQRWAAGILHRFYNSSPPCYTAFMKHVIPWWQSKIAYQIYPRSFCDSNNDGIGDIPGIISKLDYLVELGVGIIWLSPVYRSPNEDMGYDISGYREINPEYGTMEDMKTLIQEAKKRDLKLIMDLVVNHTSDEHPWFVESRKGKDNPYREFYIWQPGKENPWNKGGKPLPPNNWSSFFTGSAWEYDRTSQEFYLHLFSKKQPDLNWHNPQVRAAVKDIMTFWLDLGIDGFRCDVINLIYKSSLENGKKRLSLTGQEWYNSQEGCQEILRELRQDVLTHYDCFVVGETVLTTVDQAKALCPPDRSELDMVFTFEHVECHQINNKWFKTPFRPHLLMNTLIRWQQELDWNTLYFENHDQPRSTSRFGSKKYPVESAKMLALILLTLRGTPFIFQGQEIGMTNGEFKSISEFRDVEAHTVWAISRKLKFPRWLRMKMLQTTSRDNARTPMQWNDSPNGGFSSHPSTTPWLKVNSNCATINVASQKEEEDSLLNWYKQLIQLRKITPQLIGGTFTLLYQDKHIYAYKRSLSSLANSGDKIAIVVLNYSSKSRSYPAPLAQILKSLTNAKILASVYPDTTTLPPYGAFLLEAVEKV